MAIVGWIILGMLWLVLCALSCNAMDNHYKKKYMLIINFEVHYFEFYQDAIDYVKLSEIDGKKECQLYVKDKGNYIFIANSFDD